MTKEEGHRNEAEARLHAALEQVEENQKNFDGVLQEKDNEIRTLKEEVCVYVHTQAHGACVHPYTAGSLIKTDIMLLMIIFAVDKKTDHSSSSWWW